MDFLSEEQRNTLQELIALYRERLDEYERLVQDVENLHAQARAAYNALSWREKRFPGLVINKTKLNRLPVLADAVAVAEDKVKVQEGVVETAAAKVTAWLDHQLSTNPEFEPLISALEASTNVEGVVTRLLLTVEDAQSQSLRYDMLISARRDAVNRDLRVARKVVAQFVRACSLLQSSATLLELHRLFDGKGIGPDMAANDVQTLADVNTLLSRVQCVRTNCKDLVEALQDYRTKLHNHMVESIA